MLDARKDDGYMAAFTPPIGTNAGNWRPIGWPATPAYDPDGWVGNLKPFVIESQSQFRSDGPNALTSGEYAKDYNEVKELGALSSTKRTADQTDRGSLLAVPAGGALQPARPRPRRTGPLRPRHLQAGSPLRDGEPRHGRRRDQLLERQVPLGFWRPRAAIREGETDGNPATIGDPRGSRSHPSTGAGLTTPPFPDHPSGHGCVSGAVLRTFREFFGTDKVAFDINSGRFPNQPRHFDRFSHAMKEVVNARVWGGIHFRTADVQGAVMGKKVAFWLQKHYFNPVKR